MKYNAELCEALGGCHQKGAGKTWIYTARFDSLEIRAGIEVAKTQFPDSRHRPFFHAVEQVCEISVKVVIHLEWVRRLAQQHAPRPAEHLHEPAILQGKQAVNDREDGRFIAHP